MNNKSFSFFKRIVSLAPSITETLFACGFGDRIVGRTQQCDWPERCASIPVVGGFSTVKVEEIYAMKPDLVYGTTLHKRLLDKVKKSGIMVATIPPYPVFKAPSMIKCIGMVTGAEQEFEALAECVQSEIASVKNTVTDQPSKVVCYLCNFHCQSWYDCCIAASIEFMNCKLAGRRTGENTHSIIEKIVADSPELILVPRCRRCSEECINPLLSTDNQLSRFIHDKKIPVCTLKSKLLARSGPRAGQALRGLAHSLFGL